MRRKYYPPTSPAGKGAKWECAVDHGQEWQAFDMDTQCLIEEAWAKVSCCLTQTIVYLGVNKILEKKCFGVVANGKPEIVHIYTF